MKSRIAFALFALTCTWASRPATAQSELYRIKGDTNGDGFGTLVAGGGDCDGDGVPDLLIGATGDDNTYPDAGSVRLVSGQDGAVKLVIDGDQAFRRIGDSAAFLGDVDNDGFADFGIGDTKIAPDGISSCGRIRVYSGRTASVLHVFLGPPVTNMMLHGSVATAGDVDGDGTADVLAGWPNAVTFFMDEGEVQVFSGSTGNVVHTLPGVYAHAAFGRRLDSLGDLNHDGYDDFAASETPPIGSAIVRVYSGRDAASLQVLTGVFGIDEFSGEFAAVGDIDQDGVGDVCVRGTVWPQPNYVRAYSGATWLPLFEVQGNVLGDGFGSALDAGGDWNADGRGDILVGVPGVAVPGVQSQVRGYSGNGGLPLFVLTANDAGQQFGSAVAFSGDLDGDARADIVMQTQTSANGLSGAVSVVATRVTQRVGSVSEHGSSCGSSDAKLPHLQFTGRPTPDARVALSLTNIAGTGVGLLFMGTEADSIRIPPTSCMVQVQPLLLVGSSWQIASLTPSSGWAWASSKVPAGLAGKLTLQAFVIDPSVAPGFSSSNGVTVVFE